nr:hypothetical protein [Nicotiana tabacum]
MGFLARERFCDMDAQPNSVGRLAHLTDDEILDRFDRISKSLSHYSEQWSFRSRSSRLTRLGSRSNRNLYALVGFRLNLIAYLSGANKRESFRMGSSSDAEPMREGEAGIDSFQEPVERKDFFPAFLPFQKNKISLGWHRHKRFD